MNQNNFIVAIITFFILCVIFIAVEEYFTYDNPWQSHDSWDWNWWRRWNHHPRGRRPWKPRCPQGCVHVGRGQYGCPNPSLSYGNWACKYDFDCQNC